MFFSKQFEPVKKQSGFRMDGYYVWCASMIKGLDGLYYLFAARWPESTGFPDGYMTHSEIVLATSASLDEPFVFRKVVIGSREGNYWDSGMAHNPFVLKIDHKYVLFYIGTQNGSYEQRAIGYAVADSLDGEWMRSDEPISLPANANNPSVLVDDDGSILLFFRDGNLKVSVARAARYDAPFGILNDHLFPEGPIEDMYVMRINGRYEMFAEDAQATYTENKKGGVHFISDDGIHWTTDENPTAYGFEIDYDDGSHVRLQRRERPQVYIENGCAYLLTTAKINGADLLTGGQTWSMIQRFR